MDEPEYAYTTFIRHYESADFDNRDREFVMLELGPGDSISSGIIASFHGAIKSYLIDKGSDAIASARNYATLFNYLEKKNSYIHIADKNMSVGDILDKWNISYLTNGLDSLAQVPDASVDYLWSQSVLEHIRKSEFDEYIKEFRRIVADNGISVHGVDLKDHLSYSHNNLRFSEEIWESDFMANSGFYTNRILYSEMIEVFQRYGFETQTLHLNRWDSIPTPRSNLDPAFQKLEDDDLLISEFDIILRPVDIV